jgi:hypothetical protein
MQQYSIVGLRVMLQEPKFATIWSEMKIVGIENKELWEREGINLKLNEQDQKIQMGSAHSSSSSTSSSSTSHTQSKPPKQGPWSKISTLEDLEDDFM